MSALHGACARLATAAARPAAVLSGVHRRPVRGRPRRAAARSGVRPGSWQHGGSGAPRGVPAAARSPPAGGPPRPRSSAPAPGRRAVAARAGRPGHRRVVRRHRRARPTWSTGCTSAASSPFSDNVRSAAQIRRSNRALQRSAARGRPALAGAGRRRPGGRPGRAGHLRRHGFPAFMTAGAAGDPALTRAAYAASGGGAAGLGFTVDFAPDADVTAGPSDPAIGARSAGSSPRAVAEHVGRRGSQGFASAGIVPVLKHFPGHGSVTTDSHVGLPVQRRSLARARATATWCRSAPAVDAGASAVMVGHLDVRAVDPRMPVVAVARGRHRPAARAARLPTAWRSPTRWRWGRSPAGSAAPVRPCARCGPGEDVVLMPPTRAPRATGSSAAVRDGRLSQARLDQAATRMVALLLHQRASARRPAAARVERRGLAAAVGGRDHLGRRPLQRAARRPAGAGRPAPPPRSQRFRAAAASAGLGLRAETRRARSRAGHDRAARRLPAAARSRGDVRRRPRHALRPRPQHGPAGRLATYGEHPRRDARARRGAARPGAGAGQAARRGAGRPPPRLLTRAAPSDRVEGMEPVADRYRRSPPP